MKSAPLARLGDLTEPERQITYGVVKPGPEQDDGVLFVRGGDVLGGRISFDGLRTITPSVSAQYRRTMLRGGELLVSLVGNPGEVAVAPESLAGANIARQVGLVALRPEINTRYVMYYLMSPRGRADLFVQTGGAVQQVINLADLKRVVVPIPSRYHQDRIEDILSTYDELIENNRRRIALLEEAARQLYREWFVRLRFPGHEHTRIINGVPERWERRTFVEACSSLEDGDWIETKDQGGDDYRLLQISNIGMNEFVETGNFRYVTEQTFKRLNCRELLPGHILIARMPKPIGRAWLVTELPWRMITAVDAAIAVANEELADTYFLTHYLNSPASLEHCERRAVGATRPRIARRELAALPLLLPPRRLQIHFREFAQPLNQNRTVLHRQNENLRAARDLLLPRLVSAEIAV